MENGLNSVRVGRPVKPVDRLKVKSARVLLSDKEFKLIESARGDMDRSAFIRRIVLAYARAILARKKATQFTTDATELPDTR